MMNNFLENGVTSLYIEFIIYDLSINRPFQYFIACQYNYIFRKKKTMTCL